jgi:hypothetical protein
MSNRIPRPQFTLRALLVWLSLFAAGCGAVRWVSIGETPISARVAVYVAVGAVYCHGAR